MCAKNWARGCSFAIPLRFISNAMTLWIILSRFVTFLMNSNPRKNPKMKKNKVLKKPIRVSDRMSDVALLIRSKKTFVLTTHVNPDGDGLGAQSAMYVALKRLGKTVHVVNHDALIPRYTFLPFAKAYR